MVDVLKEFYETTSIVDLVYIIITILSLIKCYKKGFVLSVLSMAKWLLAYAITLIIFPRVKPYFKDIIDNEYFITETRLKSLLNAKKRDSIKDNKFGTVGCVAIDKFGNITSGTSTGGMTNKKWNRIGDVPIIGAGTYANNNTCLLYTSPSPRDS